MFSIQLSIQLSVDQQLPRFRPTSCPPNRSYIPFMFLIMAQSCREETWQISGFSYLYFFKKHRKAMAMNLAWCILSLPRLFRCSSMLCWYNKSFVTTDYSLIFMHFSIYPSLGEYDLFLTMHICVVRPCWFKYYCSFFIWYIISVWFSVLFIFCDIFFYYVEKYQRNMIRI